MTEQLKDKLVGDFIVYESTESLAEMGHVDDPEFDLVPPIYEQDVEEDEYLILESSDEEVAEEPEPEPEPMGFEIEESESDPVQQEHIVIKPSETKKPKALPVARRITKVARVVRKGEVLGTFMDDSHLDVEVDQATRLVIGKKQDDMQKTMRKKSYGQSMFPLLSPAKASDGDNVSIRSTTSNKDSGHTDSHSDDGYEHVDPAAYNAKKEKAQKLAKTMALILGHELLEDEVRSGGPLWLHAKLTREEADVLLTQTAADQPDVADGLFLVRESSKGAKAYSLDVFFHGEIHRYLFKQREDSFVHKSVVFEVDSLEELIEHLRDPSTSCGLVTSPRSYVSRLGGTNNYFNTSC
jgi:hypothetical protein